METNREHPKGRTMIFGVRYVEALGLMRERGNAPDLEKFDSILDIIRV